MSVDSAFETQDAHLLEQAQQFVQAALKKGADQAEAIVAKSSSLSVSVRNGELEETDSSESNGFTLRCFVGNRSASVSANQLSEFDQLAERAVAMAKVSPENPFAGLLEEEHLATDFHDLDLQDKQIQSATELQERALACEAAALAVEGVSNSSGASASFGRGGMVLATSNGFNGSYASTRHSCSVSVVAGEGTSMERDYDYDSRVHLEDLRGPDDIGRRAGEQTVRRVGPKQVPSQQAAVVYDPRVASGLVSHFSGAINGASIARKTSFLREKMGDAVFGKSIRITDDPHRSRGLASRPFDGEGASANPLNLVENGILQHWLLDRAAAKELGLTTNGRAARSGGQTSPSSTNLTLHAGDKSPEELMREIGTGLYITELIGRGVNMVTGDYSRGVSGYWIENGEITYPVSEITVAGSLADMFARLVPANDLEYKTSTNAPTVLIEGMTIAGR
ncbi:MAG: TldD/PmbA family protein [Pseudomonadota bacterium]